MNKLASPKTNLHQVLPSEFDLNQILVALNEGRLFIQPKTKSEAELREEGIQKILQYVCQIDDCASDHYRQHIQQLWHDILCDERLQPLFFLGRYRTSRGQVNWYRVNVFICLLREWNVYQHDRYTGVDLHLRCERTDKRNTHYTCMNRYLLEHRDMVLVKRLIQAFSEK